MKNEEVKTTVSLIDIYPTLIVLCNLPVNKKLEGVSLVSALRNASTSKEQDVFIPHAAYDVMPEEKHFVVVQPIDKKQFEIIVVQNWFKEFEDKNHLEIGY